VNIQKFKIADLTEFPGNYNKHGDTQLEHLGRSLTRFEQVKNIVVWKNKVIAGNGLVKDWGSDDEGILEILRAE
jgi:hypothetical protein